MLVLALLIATPATAQTSSDEKGRALANHERWDTTRARWDATDRTERQDGMRETASNPLETIAERLQLRAVQDRLSATRTLRTADALAGVALIAYGRRSHLVAPAVFLGLRAIRLGVGKDVPPALRQFDVVPQIGRHEFAVTFRRTLSP